MTTIGKNIIALLVSLSAISANASSLALQGDSAYIQDRFDDAVELYNQAIAEDGVSSLLYYNLGNAYYRSGKTGKAIVNYERALILDPRNNDARANLEFVNGKITDKPQDNATILTNIFNKTVNLTGFNAWAWLAVAAFILLICAAGLYIFSSGIVAKKCGFFGAIILLVVTVATIIFSYTGASRAKAHNMAIVIEPSTMLSTSPRAPKERTEEALLLHEGTKVEIVDSAATPGDSLTKIWYDVKINANRAWIRGNAIEKI